GVHDRRHRTLQVELPGQRMASGVARLFLRDGQSRTQRHCGRRKSPHLFQELPGHLNPLSTSIGASTPGLRGKNSGIANAAPTQPRSEKLFSDLNHIGNAKSIAASGAATASYCAARYGPRLTAAAVWPPYPQQIRALVDLAPCLSETGKASRWRAI